MSGVIDTSFSHSRGALVQATSAPTVAADTGIGHVQANHRTGCSSAIGATDRSAPAAIGCEYDTAAIIGRVEHIALLVSQISDSGWVTELISTLRRPGWHDADGNLLMLELTVADVERSANRLLALVENLVTEIGECSPAIGLARIAKLADLPDEPK